MTPRAATQFEEIAYRPRGRFPHGYIGAHPSAAPGGTGVFRDAVPFARCPDARRIDIRATIRDPFGETYVRRFEQRMAIDLYALVDLSGSMRYRGTVPRLALASQLCATLAYSATRIGDRFGLIGFDGAARRDTMLPATRVRGAAIAAAEHVAAAPCFGASARGILDAAALIGAQRKLVVVISDFRLPSSLLKEMFDALAAHDVAPIMLADSQEEALPKWGLSEIADLEDGRRRLVVMRPALRRRWREQEAARRAALSRLSMRHGRELFVVTDRIDAPRLTRHLMAA